MRGQPGWRKHPVVVVAEDRPTAEILHASTTAIALGIAPGMRLGAARAMTRELRAGVVTAREVSEEIDGLFRVLTTFSPRIEPCPGTPGRFYADPAGLEGLFGELAHWASAVHAACRARSLASAVVVGFHRMRTTAIAAVRRGPHVLATPERERALAAQVPLVRLGLSHASLVALAQLEVRTLGDLVRLPADALGTRFGPEVRSLVLAATTPTPLPVQGETPLDPITLTTEVDPPDDDVTRLLFSVRASLITFLSSHHEAITRIVLTFTLDAFRSNIGGEKEEKEKGGREKEGREKEGREKEGEGLRVSLEPAQPTRDEALLVELVRLRLSAVALAAPVSAITLVVHGVRNTGEQLGLFPVPKKQRDVKAAARAIARLRAAFGDGSVSHARGRTMHLPEASFRWEAATGIALPRPQPPVAETPRLARRLLAKPRLLPDPPRVADDPWPTTDRAHGPLVKLVGPYRLSGGWWSRAVERDYYWAETRRGDLLWVFYDRPRRRWFLHAVVD